MKTPADLLRLYRTLEHGSICREQLEIASAVLQGALDGLSISVTEDSLRTLNGAWAAAWRVYETCKEK